MLVNVLLENKETMSLNRIIKVFENNLRKY